MEDCSERLVSRRPVIVRRRVRWGDCDPAGIVYTPVFGHYAVSAFNWLMESLLGGPLHAESQRLGFATPFKALSFEFHSPLSPDQAFDMICTVSSIRTRTFDIDILARSLDQKDVFASRMTPIFIARGGERRSIAIPPEFLARLTQYQRECPPTTIAGTAR